MNVFDFDKTIYKNDSSIDFYIFSLIRHPSIIKYLPYQKLALLKFLFGVISKTKMKESFYCFFKGIKDIDKEVELFWNKNSKKINQWYLDMKKDDDVIISASPTFHLKPICKKLGIKVIIASEVDKKTGKYTGLNCWGEEKVNRFRSLYENTTPERFYSDSYSDSPMAKISKKAFIVKGNKIIPW